MKRLAAALFVCALPLHAEVREMKLPTAEDGEIAYRVDNRTKQAENAKDDRAETLPVSTAFVGGGSGMHWTFVYRVRFKEGVKPVSIRVETENQKPVTLEVEDKTPQLRAGEWTGTARTLEFSRFWAEKIASNDAWMLQRRYTIVYADGGKSILHQLSILSREGRARMLETMRR